MANVWFVHRVGGIWKTVGADPAFRRPLGDLIFKLDLGPQRRQAVVPDRDELIEAAGPKTKVFIEVLDEDVKDSHFGGYYPGWYDSPYAAPEATRRLG